MSRLSPRLFQLSAVRATLRPPSSSRYADGSRREEPRESDRTRHPLLRRSRDLLCLLLMSVRGLSRSHFSMQSSIRRLHASFTGFTPTRIPSLISARFGRSSFRRLRRIPSSFGSCILEAGASCFQRLAESRRLSRRGCLTRLFGSILMSISPRMEPNHHAQ